MSFEVGDEVVFMDSAWGDMVSRTGTVTELLDEYEGKERVRVNFDNKSGNPMTIWFAYRFRKLTKLEKVLK